MTLPGPSVPRPTDHGQSVPGPLKLAECSQYWKNQELAVQELMVQEVSVQKVRVQELMKCHETDNNNKNN